ncbi:MAG: hypothetical protein R2823_04635 [Acidimicrobiia bacterium]
MMFRGLGRGMDMRFVSNRIVAGGFLVALGGFVTAAAIGGRLSYLEAVGSAFAVGIGWAIGRELDPDRAHVASLAMLAAATGAIVARPDVLVCAAALLTLRMVTGSVGRFLGPTDLLLVALVGFGSGGALWAWPIGIVAFAALRSAPEFGPLRWWAVGVLTVSFVTGWYRADLAPVTITGETALIAAGCLVAAALSMIRVVAVSPTDRAGGSIEVRRVRLSRLSAASLVGVAALVGGVDAFWAIAPVGGAVAAVAVGSVVALFVGSVDLELDS